MAETMESATCSEANRSYSWWWDSHTTPKNSKWLQENLTNMDNKIKSMIKLIEEDADSFARRAEMYYKKRPELMKLVEEFYRAYRALAERYDHVTGALRQAHRTIAVAFPNQIQLILADEPPSGLPDSVEEEKETFSMQSYSFGNAESPDEIEPFMSKEEWKHLNCLLADEEAHKKLTEGLLVKGLNFKEDAEKNSDIKKLQEEVAKLSIENVSLKNEIISESMRADKSETESQGFKDAVSKLKSQLEAAFLQYKVSQESMSYLETEISRRRDEAHHLNDEMSIKVTKLNIAEDRCLDLEKENRSLRLELCKFNEAVSKQMEEVSDLFKENQNLHNTVKLESLRAEKAEAESCRLRDSVLKLNSELGTSLLQYKVSQERISDLEAEICRTRNQFQDFNVEISKRSFKLNTAEEQYIVLQEENKSLQSTVDRLEMIVAKQVEEVTSREDEFCKLKQFIEDEHRRFKYAGIQERLSLQTELNELRQRITGHEEVIAAREKELDKLKQSLEDEQQRRMIAEIANQSLKRMCSQSEEKIRLLGFEIASGSELLTRMELNKTGLEEEIKRLHDENNVLNEKSFSSISKIVGLQDQIHSLRRSKLKIADELRFHLDENKSLQQELSFLRIESNNLEERHHELMEQIVEVNFNVVSLQALVQELLVGKTELKDACKKHEGEKPFNLEDLRPMESLSVKKYLLLEHSLSDVTAGLEWLGEKIKGLQECCKSLHGNVLSHASDNNVMVSHAEAVIKNKLSDKSTLFENSLSENIFEFEGLREKVIALEESFKSLYDQNCYLIAENNNLVAQVEKNEEHMESLENRFSTFEGKHVKVDNEKDLALYQVEEFKGLLKLAKEDHENRFLFFKNQTSALNNQIHILKEKNQLINEELEYGLLKTVNSDFDCFITQQILYDVYEKNLILSDECQKHIDKLRCVEKLTSELRQDQSTQAKKLASLLEHNRELFEWIHVMVRAFDAKEDSEASNAGYKNLVQFISHKMIDLTTSVTDSNEEFHHVHLEKSPFTVLLEELGLSFVELRAHKNVLEKESEKKNEEISVLHSKCCQLMEVNEQLRKDLNASNQQKDDLKAELEKIHRKLSDLQEMPSNFHGEIPKLFVESECISSKSFELREQTDSQEEEHEAIFEEFMIHENLFCNFGSSDAEKSPLIDQLIDDVYNLHGITNDLGQDIRVINENLRALQNENMHLRDLAVNFETRNSILLEDDIHKMSEGFGKLNPQSDARKNQLEQTIMEWSETHSRIQNMQLNNKNLCINLEGLIVELNKANVAREELEKTNLLLSKENVCIVDEKEFLRQSNEKLVGEISRLHTETEALRRREKNLTSELLRAKNVSRCFEEESAAYLLDVNVASINELVFKQKFVELMVKVKGLEASEYVQSKIALGEISTRNVQRGDLVKKANALEKENIGLKAELTAYLPHLVSLDNDIASLEEQSLSLANDHILSSKRKQGNNLLAPLQRKRFSQVRGKDHISKASAGIMELKKMHAKVKQLQMAVTDTEKILAQEDIVTDTNLVSETRKIKARRSKGSRSAREKETEKKKDIILDTRKSTAADKGVRLIKIDQEVSKVKHKQMTKDIELDHILSSFRSEDDPNSETDQQAREMLDPATNNVEEHQKIDIMEGERSENPSSELFLEKEFSVDKLEMPINDTRSHLEWSRRVTETLSSDALRLSILQENLEELKKKIEVSEMSSQSPSSASNSITEQLKISEGVIKQLIDINFKLTKMAGDFSVSLDDNEGRRQISERVQIASEKIDVVELEVESTQFLLSKLLEEQESKALKALQRKSKFPLKGFIYWKRNDSRQKKRRFCACMRLNTKGD
ncbi:hypothetical protein IEQ34_013459 [Dendrobium chrysotoxum]|uniref:NAB domain-containing protein n=1 Tax=Dendrobium chrysotoxum TaxID=161865 RepID=A0AAV7G8I6_DENCH|nr:hypothetical protein IEQ34_013459 [Dendrobium chrysotoxum]